MILEGRFGVIILKKDNASAETSHLELNLIDIV